MTIELEPGSNLSSSSSPPPGPLSSKEQVRALGILALVALALLVRIAVPVGVGLLIGTLVAFTLRPVYEWLRHRQWRAEAAGLFCSLGIMGVVTAALTGLGYLLVTRGVVMASAIPAELAPGGNLRQLADHSTGLLTALHLNPAEITGKLQSEAMSLGPRAATFAAGIAGFTFGGFLTLLFMTLTTYYVLCDWTKLVIRAEETLPLNPRHTRALFDQFRDAGRQVLLGTVSTGIIQGVLAAIGYWITGVPEPAFFGAVTAVASLVPAIGTLLVWVPMGIYQIATGHAAAGIILLAYGALIVGVLTDYVIRPRLVGHEKGVPTVLTFVALFGGAELFGLIGLILGPVIVNLSMAVLRTYQLEIKNARATIIR